MGSNHNFSDTAKVLAEARRQIKTGENVKKKHPVILKETKLTDSVMLDKKGIPVKETDQNKKIIISE